MIPDNMEQITQRLKASEEVRAIATNRVTEASLCVKTLPSTPDGDLDSLLQLDPTKVRPMPSADAQEWMKIFQEALEIAEWRKTLDHQVISPWSSRPQWLTTLRQVI